MADAFIGRGIVYHNQGQHDRAIKDYDQAIRLNPNHAGLQQPGFVYSLRANTTAPSRTTTGRSGSTRITARPASTAGSPGTRKDQDDRAIQDFDQAIRLDPTWFRLPQPRLVLQRQGQYDRAIEDFDRALRLNPDDAALFNNRCYAKASAGALAAALADCNEALRRMPGNWEFLDTRAFTYLKMQQLPQALADYDAALKIAPGRRPPCSAAASCAAGWGCEGRRRRHRRRHRARCRGGRAAGAPRRRSVSGRCRPRARRNELMADLGDKPHSAPGGGVAGSRRASLRRTRCSS